MSGYDEECIEVFFRQQGQLFPKSVADTLEEAEAFLEDCMAVVCDDIDDVAGYLDESGMDVAGMSKEEIEDCEEVFALSKGRYLVVMA